MAATTTGGSRAYEGRVVDDEGRPLVGVRVRHVDHRSHTTPPPYFLFAHPGPLAQTDRDGGFRFESDRRDVIWLEAVKSGYVTAYILARPGCITNAFTAQPLDQPIRMGRAAGISGQVTWPDGRGVPEATVLVERSESARRRDPVTSTQAPR